MEYPDKIIRGDGKKTVNYIREDKVAGYINHDPWVLRDVAEKASCDLRIFETSDVAGILSAYRTVILEKVNRDKKHNKVIT